MNLFCTSGVFPLLAHTISAPVSSEVSPIAGSHDAGDSGVEDGGKPKAHSGGFDHNNTKNDKVGGKVTGGNQHAFKA